MSSVAKIIIILVSLLCVTSVFAEQKNTNSVYQQGVEFLRSKQFSLALERFNKAEDAGLKSPSLHYNRGVTLYRLGQYPEAKQAFTAALNDADNVALVHYNLGLVEARLGNTSAAKRAFSRVASFTTSRQLAQLSNKMIARLDGNAEPKSSASKRPLLALMVDAMLGYDDNVTLASTELAQGSSLSDMYYDLYASLKYPLAGDRKNGYWMQAGVSTVQYQDYGQYDYTQYSASLFRHKQYSHVDTRMGLKYGQIYVGGSDYLKKYTARIQASYALSKQQKLRARYELAVYDELDAKYSYLAGTRSKIKLDSIWRNKGKRTRLGYELELNDRDDRTLGNSFISYSATRHKVYGDFSLMVSKALKAKLSIDYRQSHYNDANVSVGVTSLVRKDDRFRITVASEYRLNRVVDLVAKYRYSDNDSNIVTRQYQRNQFLVGAQSYF